MLARERLHPYPMPDGTSAVYGIISMFVGDTYNLDMIMTAAPQVCNSGKTNHSSLCAERLRKKASVHSHMKARMRLVIDRPIVPIFSAVPKNRPSAIMKMKNNIQDACELYLIFFLFFNSTGQAAANCACAQLRVARLPAATAKAPTSDIHRNH